MQALAGYHRLEIVDLSHARVDPLAVNLVPPHIAHRHQVLPLERQDTVLVVATAFPGNEIAEEEIRMASRLTLRWVVAVADQIRAELTRYYGSPQPEVGGD